MAVNVILKITSQSAREAAKIRMKKDYSKQVTVQDVALLANVSVATVSRTLSKPEKVSKKTQAIVMKAVKETGYTVNEAARSLRRQRTNTIVILVPDIGNLVFSNIVEGIEKVCAANGINVLIADTKKASMSPLKARSYFSQNRVDGVIILDGSMPLDVIDDLPNAPKIVFAGEWNPAIDLPIVKVDNTLGIGLAVKHLYDLEHRNIGQISGSVSFVPGSVRSEAFYQALSELNSRAAEIHDDQTETSPWCYEGDYTLESGAAAAKDWYKLPAEKRPSGIVCAADAMAYGFISQLHQFGLSVPKDVSIVGFDDLEFSAFYVPALTTVHQPRRTMGKLAAQTLITLIKDQDVIVPDPIEPWLVVRGSTRRLNQT